MKFKKYTVYKGKNQRQTLWSSSNTSNDAKVGSGGYFIFRDQWIHTKDFIVQNDKLYGMK
jgi:hypothetical protein